MRKGVLISIFIIALGLIIIGYFEIRERTKYKGLEKLAIKDNINITIHMKIFSSAFMHNQQMLSKFTCDDANVNPPLNFDDVPPAAKSLVLIMDDPDAPLGTWLHWTMWNINPQTKKIAENTVPEGAVEGVTDFGSTGYGGPCPPSGEHRYFFKLYALDTMLDLAQGAKLDELENAMEGHILDKAELIGLYKRIKIK
ncbi:YbhB/YbcL family Raf kinase inhibitor-like protein [Patescibacteria group bacterium]